MHLLMNLLFFIPKGRAVRKEDSEKLKEKDNLYVVDETFFFLIFFDGLYKKLVKWSCH